MKKNVAYLLGILMGLTLVFTSCDKAEDEESGESIHIEQIN